MTGTRNAIMLKYFKKSRPIMANSRNIILPKDKDFNEVDILVVISIRKSETQKDQLKHYALMKNTEFIHIQT